MTADAVVIRGARAIWTGSRTVEGADVWLAGGEVAAIVPSGGSAPAELAGAGVQVVDANGCAVVPGLVQRPPPPAAERVPHAARHASRADAGVAPDDGGGLRPGGRRPRPRAPRGARRTRREPALRRHDGGRSPPHWPAGCDDVGIAEATAAAARSLGARLVFVRGTAGDDRTPQQRASRRSSPRSRARSDDGRIAVAVGPAGVHSDGPETFAALRAVAVRHGLPRRTQACEQVDVEVAAERYGARPLELLDRWGWLEEGVTIAHLCDVTPGEIARLAQSGATRNARPGLRPPDGLGPGARRRAPRCRHRRRARHERRRLQRCRAPARRRATRDAGRAAPGAAAHGARVARHGDHRIGRWPRPHGARPPGARRRRRPCDLRPRRVADAGVADRSAGCSGPPRGAARATCSWVGRWSSRGASSSTPDERAIARELHARMAREVTRMTMAIDQPGLRPTDRRADYDAIVIGGGHNGLTCAAYLARAGGACSSSRHARASAGAPRPRRFSAAHA